MRIVLLASLLMLGGCGGSPMSVETRSEQDRARILAEQQAEFTKRRLCGRHASRCDPGQGAGS